MKKIIIFILLLFIIITGTYIYKQNKITNSENSSNLEFSNTSSNEIQNEINNENLINETNSSKANTTENTSTNILAKSEEKNKEQSTTTETAATIAKKLSPSGFMGSSLYRVDLYSNGDVYAITFDGNGYEDSNIVSKKLVAKNASSIEMDESDEGQGGIVIIGGEKIDENFGWISFGK